MNFDALEYFYVDSHCNFLFFFAKFTSCTDFYMLEGEIDHADLLASMDEQISKAKEEAYSRTDIMEKVEKWIVSSEEERWLEEYSRVIFL